jgi:nucleoside-diphosphate-sugar epimerase
MGGVRVGRRSLTASMGALTFSNASDRGTSPAGGHVRVAVVGATGHIGSYLVPELVEHGHDVVALSRGTRRPYRDHPAWDQVRRVTVDRDEEDARGTFGGRLADLRADAVVDLVCFRPDSAQQIVDALRSTGTILLHCGTIWVHGPAVEVPVTEDSARNPFGEYGTDKAAVERLLLAETANGGLRSTVLHPGHISGPGWPIINPAANLDPDVWRRLATGQPLSLPNFGLETVHHVHADDVAQAFVLALEDFDRAAGESFHVVSEAAITLRGFAEAVAGWFGRQADLSFLPWEEYQASVAPEHAQATWEHVARSPSMSIAKARARLGYRPRHTSLASAAQALRWLAENDQVEVDAQAVPAAVGR